MTSIKFGELVVDFPYTSPYDLQKVYMNKVLECLKERKHGVLESPTGTGKTLCLFAPVTAWASQQKQLSIQTQGDCDAMKLELDMMASVSDSSKLEVQPLGKIQEETWKRWGNRKRSRVWYTARTHSQLAQTVNEVRRCNIAGLQIRVMGARDQLCVNKQVMEEKESYVKTLRCKELVKERKCRYYNKLNYDTQSHLFYKAGEVLDIEDLVSTGTSCGVCPYFMAKKASESADIVLLPYNYIIDKDNREANNLNLDNDVVIFDEGHNVPPTCEESYEFSLNTLDIITGIKNIQELMTTLSHLGELSDLDEEVDIKKHSDNALYMMETFKQLEALMENINISTELLPISSLYGLFDKCGINDTSHKRILNAILNFKDDAIKLTLSGSLLSTFYLLEKIMNILYGVIIKTFDKIIIDKSFKYCVNTDSERKNVKKINLYCFNPSFGIRSLLQLGVQSIIITSGTLSPLNTFIHELSLPTPVTLENGHIANKCQVPFLIVDTGVNNVKMDASYKNRNDTSYMFSLGMTLTNLISSVPDGVLLLFSSYAIMQTLREYWEKEDVGVWNRLNVLKRVFVEPRYKNDFLSCMENYKRAIDSGNGAMLMGVLRGKISEGMDFKDQYCRGVFIIGVPFPPIFDPKVKGKEKYAESLMCLNAVTKRQEKLYQSYISVEAMKATNQAIGRVIRHGQDYGAIVLVDYRFTWPRLFNLLSAWIRGHTPVGRNFMESKKILREFFKNVFNKQLGVAEVRCQAVDSNGVPRSGVVSYEEYDHSQAVATRAPKIHVSEYKMDRRQGFARSKRKIQYLDEEVTREEILMNYSGESSQCDSSVVDLGSLFAALDNTASTGVRYREFEVNTLQQQSNGSSERSNHQGMYKKVATNKRLGLSAECIQSLTSPAEYEEVPTTTTTTAAVAENSQRQDELKNKLLQYVHRVKTSLSQDKIVEFMECSRKYMKGEKSLQDTMTILKNVLPVTTHLQHLQGFDVCVKTRDRSIWLQELNKLSTTR